MIDSLKRSFNTYTKKPFLFVWGSMMYVFMVLVFLFAALGLLLAYFMFLSIIGQEFDLQSIPTLGFLAVIGLAFLFFSSGLNASLAKAYRSAFWKNNTSITAFYTYALEKAPQNYAILLIRDFIWLMLAGPIIAIYIYFLETVPYMDAIVGLVIVTITFVIHMMFTPALLSAGALEVSLFNSLRLGFNTLRRRHIMFIGLYFLFAIVWILNFIPFVQLVTIFFLYPVLYTALIVMMENTGKQPSRSKKKRKIEEEEEEY
ncbi:MAG: hypothetical protein ABID61_01075 [Candidatus Micrarchaeota archaeon]